MTHGFLLSRKMVVVVDQGLVRRMDSGIICTLDRDNGLA